MINTESNNTGKKSFSIRFHNFLEKADSFSTKHWLVTSLFLVGSSWWFSMIVTFWGESLHLIQSTKNGHRLTIGGIIASAIVFIILVLNSAITKHRNGFPNKTLSDMTASFKLLDRVMSALSNVCATKISTQVKEIERIKQGKIEPPIIYSDPCVQFETIIQDLVECLAFVLSTNENRIKSESLYASIAFNFPQENASEWRWVNVKNQQGLDLSSLLNKETLFLSLINDHSKSFEFYNSKQFLMEKHKYHPDECDKYDKDKNLLGSIACFKINVKRNDETYIRAVLSVSSYDMPFVKSEDIRNENQTDIINTRENIRKIIVEEFSKHIKIELCNYYLQFLRQKWDDGQKK